MLRTTILRNLDENNLPCERIVEAEEEPKKEDFTDDNFSKFFTANALKKGSSNRLSVFSPVPANRNYSMYQADPDLGINSPDKDPSPSAFNLAMCRYPSTSFSKKGKLRGQSVLPKME